MARKEQRREASIYLVRDESEFEAGLVERLLLCVLGSDDHGSMSLILRRQRSQQGLLFTSLKKRGESKRGQLREAEAQDGWLREPEQGEKGAPLAP